MTYPELMISASIIGGAIFVAAPKYKEATQKAKAVALRHELTIIRKSIDQFNADTDGFPDSIEDLTRECAPASFWKDGVQLEWGKKKWSGPYLAFGEVGVGDKKNDPVSEKPYKTVRNDVGRLKVFSSAAGKDSDGVEYRKY